MPTFLKGFRRPGGSAVEIDVDDLRSSGGGGNTALTPTDSSTPTLDINVTPEHDDDNGYAILVRDNPDDDNWFFGVNDVGDVFATGNLSVSGVPHGASTINKGLVVQPSFGDTGPTNPMLEVIAQPGSSVAFVVRLSGVDLFRVDNDGTVHIPTGTSILADLS